MAFNDPDMEADHLDEPIWPTTGPDFREGTETNVSPDLTHLRMLQAALPSACMLTNNGKVPGSFLNNAWGTAKNDAIPSWHLFNARSYKQMQAHNSSYHCPAATSSGESIRQGLTQTVYLQCGPPEENALRGKARRFYTDAAAWFTANPREKAQQRRFEGGLGAASVGSPSGSGTARGAPSCSSA